MGTDGFTTIIIQGTGFGGFGLPLDTFTFGDINGVSATYLYGLNAEGAGQWWAVFELEGNAASYDVDVLGYSTGTGVPLSVTEFVVDTYFSTEGYATDQAVLSNIPEPSAALLGAIGALGMLRRRRK